MLAKAVVRRPSQSGSDSQFLEDFGYDGQRKAGEGIQPGRITVSVS